MRKLFQFQCIFPADEKAGKAEVNMAVYRGEKEPSSVAINGSQQTMLPGQIVERQTVSSVWIWDIAQRRWGYVQRVDVNNGDGWRTNYARG